MKFGLSENVESLIVRPAFARYSVSFPRAPELLFDQPGLGKLFSIVLKTLLPNKRVIQ